MPHDSQGAKGTDDDDDDDLLLSCSKNYQYFTDVRTQGLSQHPAT
jgi:hypothetical protein